LSTLIHQSYKEPTELLADWSPEKMTEYFMKHKLRSKLQQMINSQPELALKKYKNCVYFGGIKDNNKQGYGVLMYFGRGGSSFEGLFNND
jgi:hypothetical protein